MTKFWNVTGQAFDRETGNPVGKSKVEIVDNLNTLFKKCKSILDVKTVYENFWNNLNHNSEEIVLVSEVTPFV